MASHRNPRSDIGNLRRRSEPPKKRSNWFAYRWFVLQHSYYKFVFWILEIGFLVKFYSFSCFKISWKIYVGFVLILNCVFCGCHFDQCGIRKNYTSDLVIGIFHSIWSFMYLLVFIIKSRYKLIHDMNTEIWLNWENIRYNIYIYIYILVSNF